MSDLISRQQAIDYVDCGHLRPPTELAWSDLDVVNMLKRLPSAEPQIIACGEGELITNLAEVGTMTKAEAIDVIRDYLVNKVDNEPMQKACQLAIKALSAEPQECNTDGLHKHYEHYNGMEKLLAEPQERKTSTDTVDSVITASTKITVRRKW